MMWAWQTGMRRRRRWGGAPWAPLIWRPVCAPSPFPPGGGPLARAGGLLGGRRGGTVLEAEVKGEAAAGAAHAAPVELHPSETGLARPRRAQWARRRPG